MLRLIKNMNLLSNGVKPKIQKFKVLSVKIQVENKGETGRKGKLKTSNLILKTIFGVKAFGFHLAFGF